MTTNLDTQIAQEAAAIANAPAVAISQLQPSVTGQAGRCGWCGRISNNLVLVEVTPAAPGVPSVERYKGLDCCGGRHG